MRWHVSVRPRYHGAVRNDDVPSEAAVRAWTRLLRAQQTAQGQVEAALKRAGLPPLAWYDVLLELERAGVGGLRPFELEKALLLPQYGLSRLLGRIEAEGLLQRRRCPEDGRGQRVFITAAGRELRRRIWPVYAGALAGALGARLSDAECETLSALLQKLL